MFEISLHIKLSDYLATEILLEESGAESISLSDAEDKPIFIDQVDSTPLWEHIRLNALFIKVVDTVTLQNKLETVLAKPIEIHQREIQDQDWQKKWMQDLTPLQFGERLWVCPSWFTPPDPFAINIRLDPGLAFGTGTHSTTTLCLEWLACYPPQHKVVIDFGCGSGILAIAAHYLGAKKVYAIDHDSQAILATKMNVNNNLIDKKYLQIYLGNTLSQHACDVLIANILLTPLIDLRDEFAKAIAPSGKLVLSGILEGQLNELKKAYHPRFRFDAIRSKKEWLLVEASLI